MKLESVFKVSQKKTKLSKKQKGNTIQFLSKKLTRIYIYLICFTSIAIVLSFFNIYLFLTTNSFVQQKSTVTVTNKNLIIYWNYFLSKNNQYLPGWIELSKLELENGNYTKALEAYKKAKLIDPNSNVVKELSTKFGD